LQLVVAGTARIRGASRSGRVSRLAPHAAKNRPLTSCSWLPFASTTLVTPARWDLTMESIWPGAPVLNVETTGLLSRVTPDRSAGTAGSHGLAEHGEWTITLLM